MVGIVGRSGGPVPATAHASAAGADAALAALYGAHYGALVRLAVLLVGDSVTAEQVVQDSFAAMNPITYRDWNTGRALASLRSSVVVRSRTALRHCAEARSATTAAPNMPVVAGHGDMAVFDGSAVIAALRKLPGAQREVVALRCYCDLPDGQIAAAMGISARAVRRHVSRAMAALRPVLERGP